MNSLEDMFSNGEVRHQFKQGTQEFIEQVVELKKQFNITDASLWSSVSSSQYNEIYDDYIVSAFFKFQPTYLAELNPAVVGRKYFLNKGWVYDKVYIFLKPGTATLPFPLGATPYATGQLISVLGQPGNKDLSKYVCLYFGHPNHTTVEHWANQELPKGKYATFYAATFDTQKNNELLRMKTYCYEDQGLLSDWDVSYIQLCKKHCVFDQLVLP